MFSIFHPLLFKKLCEMFERMQISKTSKHIALRAKRAFNEIRLGLTAPIEHVPVTPDTAKMTGLMICGINAIMWYVSSYVLPQPYVSTALHLAMFEIGAVLLFAESFSKVFRFDSYYPVRFAVFLNLCVFAPWMYLNNQTQLWDNTVVVATLAYFVLNDWRIALFGTWLGLGVAAMAFYISADSTLLALNNFTALKIASSIGTVAGLGLAMVAASKRKERRKGVGVLMGVMAHELRTHLSAIRLSTGHLHEIAKVEGQMDIKQLKVGLSQVEMSAKRMCSVIDTQIANSRSSVHRPKLERVNLNDPVLALHDSYPFKSRAEAACLAGTIERDVAIMGSPQLLSQILQNLLSNALTALAKTGRTPVHGDVRIDVFKRNSKVRIEIRDHGCGISKENLRRVFEPFYSTAPGASHGLGLPFVRQVVKYFKGDIELTSAYGKGTLVVLEFPLAPQDLGLGEMKGQP